MRSHRLPVLVAAGALALGVAACGDEEKSSGGSGSSGGQKLSGKIAIDGSSTVFPFAQAAAEQFQAENPDVQITVGQSGTGGGFEKFCAAETDVSNASRPIKDDEEVPICKKEGVAYSEVQIGNDGIAVTSNKELPIPCMTTDQLKQLWEKGSKVKAYNELDPKFPTEQVSLFGPGTDLLLRAEPGQAGARGGGLRRRLHQAEQRDDPERHLQAALASPVHVSERQVDQAPRGEGLHGLPPREAGRDRRGGSDRADDA
ncbi:MAG: substrate-binding domain-containing protein [Actinobacteria bacterium]|nr:substrate-binding domain-containing protein [Actinomycetota bacterium]